MEDKIKQIMSNIFRIIEDEINEESSTENIENWDSLNHINLIISIEEQFAVSISEDEMVEMTIFNNIKRILKDKGVLKNGE